jgi:DNA helicase-2/ATP-dependent DNA helicase PcrA
LLTDADNDKEDDKNKISLMTIHAAKGLEFPNVYIVGMEEDLFPSQLSKNSRTELEEERRLFYVALTRAKQSAILSFAISRFRWGNLIQCEPSRFIEEIDPRYLNFERPKKNKIESINYEKNRPLSNNFTKPVKNLKKIENQQPKATINSSPIDTTNLNVGDHVLHERFGKGKIIELNGAFPNTKATVFFPSAGQKQLLLRFAKLQLI